MARTRSPYSIEAENLYYSGMSMVDIARKLGKPEGTVRRWKSTQKWDDGNKNERSETNTNVRTNKTNTKEEAIAEDVRQVISNPDLTDKQRLFCLHYVKCFNATKAYQKAYGVDYLTANAHGYEMLSNVVIREEILRLKQNRLNREMLDESDIFQKYMDIAFADITDFVEFGREEIPVMTMYGPLEIKDDETGEKIKVTKEVNTVRFKEHEEVVEIGTQAWDENTALANEASQRYETLESKLSMMKNSASALGIQFKDSIDGQLRNAVQVGTDSINRLSDAFTNGGLDAAVSEAGDIIADLSVRVANSAPDMVRSASSLLKSFVQGISDHRGEILNAGIEVAKALAEGIADLLPSSMSKPAKDAISVLAKSMKSGGLKEAAANVLNVFKNMANMAAKALKPAAKAIDTLADNFDKLAPIITAAYTATKMYSAIQAISNKEGKVSAIITAASTAATKLKSTATALMAGELTIATAAQKALNAAVSAFGGPIGLAITAITTLVAGIGMFALTSRDSTSAVSEESNALAENADKIREAQEARQESVDGISKEYGHYQELWDELQRKGDFIILGVNGEVYPCKPDIFEKTYELVD
ncbi:terminase small subunit [[Clostridium] scindens]|uniref:terminase small subunit n=1 Tax=Clostridium scindens (strain JCM 10418 / VPI 12708) TaxID=29347 RepID=UPI0023EBA18F|nr:terminase small subunit [[Clostridium] scindens]BDF17783.1 hypothetical protein CE91St59_30460 [[Clostridium] scindens]BDF21482.1 hypothetical protein CE91St60_30650 [[Clostridium] scindens]